MLPPVHSPLTLGGVLRGLVGDEAALDRARSLLLERYASRNVVLTDSGTTALALALQLAVRRRPDTPRVALPAWGCYDLATAADGADVGVVLYDLDPETLAPDPRSLDRALAAGVAATVVVHFYGVPVDLAAIASRAAGAGALMVEDAAQAIGTRLGDEPAGALGDLGVLSFGRGKGWTGGGGGALLLGRRAAPGLALPAPESLADAGGGAMAMLKLAAQWVLARPALYALPSALPFLELGRTVYHPPSPAARMSDATAAALLASEPLLASEIGSRRAHAARLRLVAIGAGAGRVPAGWSGGEAGWLRLPLLLGEAAARRADASGSRRLGIMPGYPIPLGRLPGFAGRVLNAGTGFPGAEELAARLYTLPTHGLLTPADLANLERWLRLVSPT